MDLELDLDLDLHLDLDLDLNLGQWLSRPVWCKFQCGKDDILVMKFRGLILDEIWSWIWIWRWIWSWIWSWILRLPPQIASPRLPSPITSPRLSPQIASADCLLRLLPGKTLIIAGRG